MKLGLNGKNVIITGGSAGIGYACAKGLISEGANLIIVGRDKEKLGNASTSLKEIAQGNQIFTISQDLTDSIAAERIAKKAILKLGKIDILINNAGSARAGSFWKLTDQHFIDAWNLKLLGYIRMIKEVGSHMKDQGHGRILNIIGTGGKTPSPTFLPGGTANAALLNFTKGISNELAESGIRINSISPGVTATDRAEHLAKQKAEVKGITFEEQIEIDTASNPLGRMVEPEEIASMALLLVSDLISSITGADIVIDNGKQPGF
ncbi:SDR family oxidoreductase [Oceanobacillus sp. CF4.6]|uniref:SDR family oxidoreductase n=1 Tax=Oceanobacillus sp. CF4.6 TaxID=3373080 RepID=UPI003EE4949A